MDINKKLNENLYNFIDRADKSFIFGGSYVQRLCEIGYNEACHTIELGLEQGAIKKDPNNEWQYIFSDHIPSVRKMVIGDKL